MERLKINQEACDLCGACIQACPFQALSIRQEQLEVNAGCRMCKVCAQACPSQAITTEEVQQETVDKSKWNGILIYIEQESRRIHPVAKELIGEAKRLASKVPQPVMAVLIGDEGTIDNAKKILQYGVDTVYVYLHREFAHFRVDNFTNALADCIRTCRPSIVLTGATSLGRSLAPRTAARFGTGLTADCTEFDIRENSDLVQIRPAFGGNIMAQILTTNHRPQFATVRYKVMEKAHKVENPSGQMVICQVTDEMAASSIDIVDTKVVEKKKAIEDAEVLVVAGRGVKSQKDVELLKELADKLGGMVAYTRPLVEAGWARQSQQIGLSGRTVKPKLIITCGVSGAIQFTAGMRQADCIVAINTDPEALIFKTANYCIVDDWYQVVPKLIQMIDERQEDLEDAISIS